MSSPAPVAKAVPLSPATSSPPGSSGRTLYGPGLGADQFGRARAAALRGRSRKRSRRRSPPPAATISQRGQHLPRRHAARLVLVVDRLEPRQRLVVAGRRPCRPFECSSSTDHQAMVAARRGGCWHTDLRLLARSRCRGARHKARWPRGRVTTGTITRGIRGQQRVARQPLAIGGIGPRRVGERAELDDLSGRARRRHLGPGPAAPARLGDGRGGAARSCAARTRLQLPDSASGAADLALGAAAGAASAPPCARPGSARGAGSAATGAAAAAFRRAVRPWRSAAPARPASACSRLRSSRRSGWRWSSRSAEPIAAAGDDQQTANSARRPRPAAPCERRATRRLCALGVAIRLEPRQPFLVIGRPASLASAHLLGGLDSHQRQAVPDDLPDRRAPVPAARASVRAGPRPGSAAPGSSLPRFHRQWNADGQVVEVEGDAVRLMGQRRGLDHARILRRQP